MSPESNIYSDASDETHKNWYPKNFGHIYMDVELQML
jgi:hypothetical protein